MCGVCVCVCVLRGLLLPGVWESTQTHLTDTQAHSQHQLLLTASWIIHERHLKSHSLQSVSHEALMESPMAPPLRTHGSVTQLSGPRRLPWNERDSGPRRRPTPLHAQRGLCSQSGEDGPAPGPADPGGEAGSKPRSEPRGDHGDARGTGHRPPLTPLCEAGGVHALASQGCWKGHVRSQ